VPKTYGQWCPVTKSLDVVGDRWTFVIVRDLLDGPRRFTELRAELRGISPTLLSERLNALTDAGVVERASGGYRLTARGCELSGVIDALGRWGMALMTRPDDNDITNAHFGRMTLRFAFDPRRLPSRPMSVSADLDGEQLWVDIDSSRWQEPVVVRPRRVDDNGADVVLACTLGALTRLAQGRYTAPELAERGLLSLDGETWAIDAMLWSIADTTDVSAPARS
jgi:DNA-binding HxlR family transcriptional regulator